MGKGGTTILICIIIAMLLDSGFCRNDGEIRNAVIPAKAKLHVHKAGVQNILQSLDTVFRRYDEQGLLQLAQLIEYFQG